VWEGEWVQISNYNMCMSPSWRGGGSALCALEGWVGDCGGGLGNYSTHGHFTRFLQAMYLWLGSVNILGHFKYK